MDISKYHIPQLIAPNCGPWYERIQSTARIINIWDAMRGNIISTTPTTTWDLLVKPTPLTGTYTATELATYNAAKTLWDQKNSQGLGLIQASITNVIWQRYENLPTAKEILDSLETEFGAAGGAQTYLQLVNMVKIQITDGTDLLPQIQNFQDNYNLIMSNGHSKLSEDLATFLFCLSLPDSYKSTTWQYLDNITAIANYKLADIIARVLQEENRRKDNALGQGSSLNKFSMTKNLGQKCAKCGKTNHTTQNHWPGGKNPNKKGKGQKPKKSDSSGKKKVEKKVKGKEKAQTSANVITISEMGKLSIQTAQSIDFSCYKTSEKVEWCLDSGCTDHITPNKSDFVQYWELGQASKAEIANGKHLKIEGYRTVIGYSIMPNKTVALQIQNVLYVPEANKQLFLLIATGQRGSMSTTMNKGTTISLSGAPYIVGHPKSGRLHSFDMELFKNKNEVSGAIIATLSDYTLWHRRMGHANQRMIKHLGQNTEGGPNQTTNAPHGACEGCEKGKSKRLPFPPLKSRANKHLI